MQCEVDAGVGEASQQMRLLVKPLRRARDSNKCLPCGAETYAVVCAWTRAVSSQDIT
jgi:hypothetical protein